MHPTYHLSLESEPGAHPSKLLPHSRCYACVKKHGYSPDWWVTSQTILTMPGLDGVTQCAQQPSTVKFQEMCLSWAILPNPFPSWGHLNCAPSLPRRIQNPIGAILILWGHAWVIQPVFLSSLVNALDVCSQSYTHTPMTLFMRSKTLPYSIILTSRHSSTPAATQHPQICLWSKLLPLGTPSECGWDYRLWSSTLPISQA